MSSECEGRVQAAAGDLFSREDARNVLGELDARASDRLTAAREKLAAARSSLAREQARAGSAALDAQAALHSASLDVRSAAARERLAAERPAPGEADARDPLGRGRLDDQAAQRQRLSEALGYGSAEARDALGSARQELLDETAFASALRRKQRLENLRKQVEQRQRVSEKAAALGRDGKPDLQMAVRTELEDVNTPVEGGRLSTEAQTNTAQKVLRNALVLGLDKEGLLKAARSRATQRAWGRELFELSKASATGRGDPGVTGDAQALKIAKVIHSVQELARWRLNNAGADVGEYSGRITLSVHDANRIRRAGFDDWHDFVAPRLDPDRHAALIGDRPALNRVYDDFVTNTHLVDDRIGALDTAPGYRPAFDVAEKAAAERVLHFKDGESWLDYQERFGRGTLIEQVDGALQRSARQQALLDRWGTKPREAFDRLIDHLKKRYEHTDTDSVAALEGKRGELTQIFEHLDGTATRPVNQLHADIGGYVRLWESLSKLGMVALTHVASLGFKASMLRYAGVSFADRWGNVLGSFLEGRGEGERRRLNDELLAGLEGMHGNLLSSIKLNDAAPGVMSGLANAYFKINLLTPIIDRQKAGAVRVVSRSLGMELEKSFAELPYAWRRGLMQHGITAAEWDVLRQAPDHIRMPDGRVFLTPKAADRAGDAAIGGLVRDFAVRPEHVTAAHLADPAIRTALGDLAPSRETVAAAANRDAGVRAALGDLSPTGEQLAVARDRLALKLHGYFNDIADGAIITPRISDRLLTFGSKPGTPGGEVLRMIAQFKQWPMAAVRQGLGREFYGGQGLAGAASGMMQLAVSGMLLGYAVGAMKDVLQGKDPRSPDRSATWVAAMMQGGGAGILGDFLFAQYGRFGQSVSDTILGPVIGQGATELFNLWNDLKGYGFGDPKEQRMASKDIGPELVRIASGNIPLVNAHVGRSAMNYLFLYSLQEALNPGYLARYERNLQNRTGQTMWLSPAGNHLHTFGR